MQLRVQKKEQGLHINVIAEWLYTSFFQVKIYKMFRILSMLDDTKIGRVGDVLEWVFRSAVKVIYRSHILPEFCQ